MASLIISPISALIQNVGCFVFDVVTFLQRLYFSFTCSFLSCSGFCLFSPFLELRLLPRIVRRLHHTNHNLSLHLFNHHYLFSSSSNVTAAAPLPCFCFFFSSFVRSALCRESHAGPPPELTSPAPLAVNVTSL